MRLAELANSITSRWERQGYAPELFSSIAFDALEQSRLQQTLDEKGLYDQLFDSLPVTQHEGNQIVVLHTGDRFDICLHFWIDGFVGAHHHAWSGAYQVLHGDCLHVIYTHHPFKDGADNSCVPGQRRVREFTRLLPGTTVRVVPGEAFIHGFAYIQNNGLTLSIRSKAVENSSTFEYFRSGLALRMASLDPQRDARVKALRYLTNVDQDQFCIRLAQCIQEETLSGSLNLLREVVGYANDPNSIDHAISVGCESHGEGFFAVEAALRDDSSDAYYASMRNQAPNDAMRVFLAALWLGLGPEEIYDILNKYDSNVWSQVQKLLELDGLPISEPVWVEGVLPIIETYVQSGCEEATLRALNAKIDLTDPDSIAMVKATCNEFRQHPLLGRLVASKDHDRVRAGVK